MKRFTLNIPYPVLPWRLIALLALALVLFIFLWMIFLGPLSSRQQNIASCEKLEQEWDDAKHKLDLSIYRGHNIEKSDGFERGVFAGLQALDCAWTR